MTTPERSTPQVKQELHDYLDSIFGLIDHVLDSDEGRLLSTENKDRLNQAITFAEEAKSLIDTIIVMRFVMRNKSVSR